MKQILTYYYKYSLSLLFISKYQYSNYNTIVDCEKFYVVVLKQGSFVVCNIFANFVFKYFISEKKYFFFKSRTKILKRKIERKKYNLGCFNFYKTNYKYFIFRKLFRKIDKFILFDSYGFKKLSNGYNSYKIVVKNNLYLLKFLPFTWQYNMLFSLLFTNNLKIIYLFFFKSLNQKEHFDFLNQFLPY